MAKSSRSSARSSTQDMFGNLADQVAALVRQELTDAINGITRRAPQAGKGLGLSASGGFLFYVAFLVMVFGLVDWLSGIMPRWLASACVGAALAAGGMSFLNQGMERLNDAGIGPEQIGDLLD